MSLAINPSASDSIGSGSTYYNDAVAGTVQQIKAGHGQIYALKLVNTTAAAAYLQVFFAPAASVTIGTTVADFVVPLAANEGTTVYLPVPVGGRGSGLSVAGTTTYNGLTGAAIKVSAIYR